MMPKRACKNSDCIITDTWFSMGKNQQKSYSKFFKPYQVNKKNYEFCKKKCNLHALPYQLLGAMKLQKM